MTGKSFANIADPSIRAYASTKLAPLEERIYRHRCVEAWSIVVPWIGYSFSTIAKLVEPNSNAKFVAFESYFDKKQMPLWDLAGIELPYLEPEAHQGATAEGCEVPRPILRRPRQTPVEPSF